MTHATADIPLERQIKRLEIELAIVRAIKKKQVQFDRIHPGVAAIELAELEAALHTLQSLNSTSLNRSPA